MKTLPVINPRSGEADYEMPEHDADHIAAAAAALRAEQPVWQAAGVARRCEVLARWREAVDRHADGITGALVTDTGRRLMADIEVKTALQQIDFWIRRAPEILRPAGDGRSGLVPSVQYRHHLVPYPVTGVISPWNVPLVLALIDAVPALLAGSSVLLKPSEVTPRFAAPLKASIDEVAELAAVLQIVTGGPETGRVLIDNVDVVCFTGSVATGQQVAVHAARNFIPAFLELGGKDPAIVLASADLDNATRAILRSAAGLTGQTCQSLERIYVERCVFDRFVTKLVERAKAIEINWPDIRRGHLGPFIFAKQADTVRAHLDDAVARGATVHCGGEILEHDGGRYCLPTVLTGVDHAMRLMREETFGPILPVMPFGDVDEAVALANDSKYGLSAAVFAGTREEGEAVAVRIRAGAVSINDAGLTAAVHDVEKNAFCLSGMGGSRMGDAGMTRFFRKQALLCQTEPAIGLDRLGEAAAL